MYCALLFDSGYFSKQNSSFLDFVVTLQVIPMYS